MPLPPPVPCVVPPVPKVPGGADDEQPPSNASATVPATTRPNNLVILGTPCDTARCAAIVNSSDVCAPRWRRAAQTIDGLLGGRSRRRATRTLGVCHRGGLLPSRVVKRPYGNGTLKLNCTGLPSRVPALNGSARVLTGISSTRASFRESAHVSSCAEHARQGGETATIASPHSQAERTGVLSHRADGRHTPPGVVERTHTNQLVAGRTATDRSPTPQLAGRLAGRLRSNTCPS